MRALRQVRSRCARTVLGLGICVIALCAAASAALPDDQIVAFRIYIDPDDPGSGIDWMIVLYLEAADSNANSIGWDISKVKVIDVNADPTSDRTWIKLSPTLSTADGLWWTEHADPDNPTLDEFALPPLIDELAAAQDSGESDIRVEFKGVPYDEPPGGPHFPITAALDWRFTENGEVTLIHEGDDEPVELDDKPVPPIES